MVNKNLSIIFLFLMCCRVEATPYFPYSVRTHDYSGYTSAPQSDTNTTGMAGATVALPASISSAQANPAGYAMETGSVSAQINRIEIFDLRIQPDGQPIDSSQWGFAVSPPPWGFSITYYSPITENALYDSALTGDSLLTEVSIKELRLNVSRYFLDSRLALGVALELVKAVRELGPYSYDSEAPSFILGALYRLPSHFVLGAGYTPPLAIGPNSNDYLQDEMVGFNRSVIRPSELDLGVGWVPNRFFKTGLQVSYIGDTTNTALLADETVTTGSHPTWVPRIGESYVIADYKNFKSEWAVGSYYETSRLSGYGDRAHLTTGLDVNPYFINLSAGFDLASDYRNFMLGIGIDIVRTLRFFDIIPNDPTPHYDGIIPNPVEFSADGLPDAMTTGEIRIAPSISLGDVADLVSEGPSNISDKFAGRPTKVQLRDRATEESKLNKLLDPRIEFQPRYL